jgi:tetratricopeptide (TPR) repeat protein
MLLRSLLLFVCFSACVAGAQLPDSPGNSSAAIEHLKRGMDLYAQYQQKCSAVAEQGCGFNTLNNAVKEYREALRLKPDYVDAHNDLGNALDDLGQRGEAITEYRTAIALNPDFAKAHNNLGIVLAKEGHDTDAIVEYRTAIRLNPSDAIPHTNLGIALARLGDYDNAIVEHRKAIEIDSRCVACDHSDIVQSHFNLAVLLEGKGLNDEAIAEYRETILLDPNKFAEAHYELGRDLRDKGDPKGALEELRLACAIELAHPTACKSANDLQQQMNH